MRRDSLALAINACRTCSSPPRALNGFGRAGLFFFSLLSSLFTRLYTPNNTSDGDNNNNSMLDNTYTHTHNTRTRRSG